MNQQKTGEFLKRLRKEKGLIQEQLAEQFYVSSRTVSRWETGGSLS
ncbi:MAG: helix-turn-helix transcriptional regulator [Lachnospiraceae bacterium]|nr:helix-turn-helix transcriptional regulator [Lachnospiraceae bacterium]